MKGFILYVQYTNPAGYPPLEQSSRILADAGWNVLFLGTEDRESLPLQFAAHPNIQVRTMGFCPAGLRQKIHYLAFGLWVLGWCIRQRPKWIYASDPLSCPISLALSFWPGLRVIYHEHDSPSPERGKTMTTFQRFTLWSRAKLGQRAMLCVLPNEKRAARFNEETKTRRPVHCVWNCPRVEEAAGKTDAASRQASDSQFVIFYHGSIVPARLPLSVIDALSLLPNRVVLSIAGYETVGHQGYVEQLKRRARELGIESRVRALGTFPRRQELLAQCRQADVGLALMPIRGADLNEQAMTGASNKPFDYLACGLALLVTEIADWKEMFVDSGCGLSCNPDDPKSIATALRWFIKNPERARQMGEQGRQRILDQWNYERQFAPVLDEMRKDN